MKYVIETLFCKIIFFTHHYSPCLLANVFVQKRERDGGGREKTIKRFAYLNGGLLVFAENRVSHKLRIHGIFQIVFFFNIFHKNMSRKAIQCWNPQATCPQTRQEEEDTWATTSTCTTSDRSTITFKAGSKVYALDSTVSRFNKISELFLKRIYR
jgi:hypothetical protein